jgi:hypothetical protein
MRERSFFYCTLSSPSSDGVRHAAAELGTSVEFNLVVPVEP